MIPNNRKLPSFLYFLIASFFLVQTSTPGFAIDLPDKFEDLTILNGLQDPASMAFSPDGRLFWGERISGKLRVASYNSVAQTWEVEPNPFYTFDVPPQRHRSAGLRGFCFDPNFSQNGYLYAFYMTDNPRHNRVVRIQANPANPNEALAGSEELLISLPFNSSTSSGSHNGGDILIGNDGHLYFTTGDGWNGGDNVQSLSTYTGKLFRIRTDGSIPIDNPFYNQASGALRAIYCLGLRNPYTMAIHPESGNIYINDAVGSQKATVYQVKSDGSSAGDNFGHDGYGGIGKQVTPWTNVSVEGKILVTGGAWYPQDAYWPEAYRGSYFAALWGSNSGDAGSIVQVTSETDLSKSTFAANVISPPRHKPVMTKIGPDGNLYYMLTDYETGDAEIHLVRYTGIPTVAAPQFTPEGGPYDDPIQVQIQSTTPNAQIYFTTDNTRPDQNSQAYTGPIQVDTSTILRAMAYAPGLQHSNETVAEYRIGPVPNIPPVADAGPDITAEVLTTITLNGANSFDPDGSELEISETWEQIGGPPVEILDADETVANFTPTLLGTYTFRITVTDIQGASDTDEVSITVVEEIPDVLDNLIARWTMEEGQGNTLEDYSPNSHQGMIQGNTWSSETPDQSAYSIAFDGIDDRVALGNLDITGNEMSLCLWYKADDWGVSDARFISKAYGQQDQEHLWMLSALQGNKLRFRLKTNGSTTTLIAPVGTLNSGTWTHVAAVYDGTFMRLYQDGIQVASTAKTGTIGSDPTVMAALGNQPEGVGGGQRPFDGLLDEVRIYGKALSEEEISIVKNAQPIEIRDTLPPNQAPIISWISPEQGIGYIAGTPIDFEVSAQDPDGSIEKVGFYWDGILVEEMRSAPYSLNLSEEQVGIHSIEAIAWDDEGDSDTTETLMVYIFPPPDSLPPLAEVPSIVHYTFEEQMGTTVRDRSGHGDPLNLEIDNPTAVQWIQGGLQLLQPTMLKAITPPSKLLAACQLTEEISMEAWVTPANYSQAGPARIMSLSQTPFARNFTLGQQLNAYEARLRTTLSDFNGRPGLLAPSGNIALNKTHVVFTRKSNGEAAIYIDGTLERSFSRPGYFSNWETNFEWVVGNEVTEDRPWLGTLHEIAVYNVALSEAYISQRYESGKPDELPFALPGTSLRKGTTSTEEGLSIYPNPVKERLHISRASSAYPVQVTIYNAQGKRVRKPAVLMGKQMQMDLSGLSSGLYFLRGELPNADWNQIFLKQ